MRPRCLDGRSRPWNFNPRIPYGMRRFERRLQVLNAIFQSTHPVWDATVLCGRCVTDTCLFQSTHPVWDATTLEGSWAAAIAYFNPRIPYGMRRHSHGDTLPATLISIHASRMGCDFTFPIRTIIVNDFNPRIPYGMRPDTIRQVGVS